MRYMLAMIFLPEEALGLRPGPARWRRCSSPPPGSDSAPDLHRATASTSSPIRSSPSATATTVGIPTATPMPSSDGSFAETRKEFGGFYLLDGKTSTRRSRWPNSCPVAGAARSRCAPIMPMAVLNARSARPRRGYRGPRLAAGGRSLALASPGIAARALPTLVRRERGLRARRGGAARAFVVALERWPRTASPNPPPGWSPPRATARSTAPARAFGAQQAAAARRASRGPRCSDDWAARRRAARARSSPAAIPRSRPRLASPSRSGRRRAHHEEIAPRLPRARADDGRAARARQAQDPRRRIPIPVPPTTNCPSASTPSRRVYLVFNEGTPRPLATRWCARSSAAKRSASDSSWSR